MTSVDADLRSGHRLETGRRLEAGRRSESMRYILNDISFILYAFRLQKGLSATLLFKQV
jgi:hypothetical protein